MNPRDLRIVKKPTVPTEAELQRQAVQRLANSVESEAHWAQILKTAESPESRAELERVVGPMLPFRRAAVCTTPDCASGLPGLWQPVLVVRSPLAPDPAWVPIELHLCETCKNEATLEDFLTAGIWAQILDQFDATTPPPIRRLTTLSWDRVH